MLPHDCAVERRRLWLYLAAASVLVLPGSAFVLHRSEDCGKQTQTVHQSEWFSSNRQVHQPTLKRRDELLLLVLTGLAARSRGLGA